MESNGTQDIDNLPELNNLRQIVSLSCNNESTQCESTNYDSSNYDSSHCESTQCESTNSNKDNVLDSMVLNLKIISKVKPGYKLSIKDNNLFIDTSYLQYFYRFYSYNSRNKTLEFLETLDNRITDKIEELVKDKNYNMFLNSTENILLNLSHNLSLSLVGLNNLINTYANDEFTISKIEMIINNFELKIRKISNILKVN